MIEISKKKGFRGLGFRGLGFRGLAPNVDPPLKNIMEFYNTADDRNPAVTFRTPKLGELGFRV